MFVVLGGYEEAVEDTMIMLIDKNNIKLKVVSMFNKKESIQELKSLSRATKHIPPSHLPNFFLRLGSIMQKK